MQTNQSYWISSDKSSEWSNGKQDKKVDKMSSSQLLFPHPLTSPLRQTCIYLSEVGLFNVKDPIKWNIMRPFRVIRRYVWNCQLLCLKWVNKLTTTHIVLMTLLTSEWGKLDIVIFNGSNTAITLWEKVSIK